MQGLLGVTLSLLAACSLAAVVTAALRVPALLGYLAAGALLGRKRPPTSPSLSF